MAEAKKAKTGQEAYYKVIDGNKYDRALLENAEEFAADGQIGYPEAKQLWQDAQDGKGVTDIERATLEYALKTYKFTPKAKNFLTTYLAAGQSKSYYKVVDGVRYDRELLESAEKAAADGQVSLPEAKELLASAADGKGVTETEKATLSFALKKLKFTDKARQFMEDSLRDVKTVTPRHRPPRAEEAEEQLPRSKEEARRARADVAQRTDCPYLGTINRHVLDFDFEKLCCVSLSGENVYVDLVDGKYFQGRGKETHAYRHALEKGHYVWMNVVDGKVFCIPDGYEVVDKSLEDIKFNLHPLFDEEEILQTSTKVRYAKALDGTDYIPGCIGLNNICSSDYQNVVVQCLCQVIPLRNMLLGYLAPKEKKADPVLSSLADLMRKMYNPRNFKGLVSPHEFYQAIGRATGKKFYAKQQDPVALFSWLMSYLHRKLKAKDGSSLVNDVFQGEVQVKLCPATDEARVIESKEKTLLLTLELPDEPLFKDNLDFIPQVPLFNLLEKFNGEKPFETIAKGGESREIRRYSLRRIPPYIVLIVKRFRNNNFFVEKNPTIVTFPLKGLDLRDYIHPDCQPANPETRYDLVANVCHDGKPEKGTYKVQVYHAPVAQWFEIHDLRVTAVLPQMVALTESYIQVYQRQDVKSDGEFGKFEMELPEMGQEVDTGVAAEIEMAPEDLAEAGIIIG